MMRRYFLTGIILCISMLTPLHPATAAGQCIQFIQVTTFSDQITLSTATINPQTWQISNVNRPTATPASLLSPDKKYAAFMQVTTLPNAVLYVANTSSGKITPIYEYDGVPNTPLPWIWSPDSTELAYVTPGEKFSTLHIVNIETGTTRSTAASSHIGYLHGWSADGNYIAVTTVNYIAVTTVNLRDIAAELYIWLAKDLSQKPFVFEEALGGEETVGSFAWAPNGHQVAMMLKHDPVQLIIWSPEHGIETLVDAASDEYYLSFNQLSWSPDGKYLINLGSDGHDYTESVFTYINRKLDKIPDSREGYRYVIGFPPDGTITLLDDHWIVKSPSLLYSLDPLKGTSRAIDTAVNPPWQQGHTELSISPDESKFIYISEKQSATAQIASIDGKLIHTFWNNGILPLFFYSYFETTWSPSGNYASVYVGSYLRREFQLSQTGSNLVSEQTIIIRASDHKTFVIPGEIQWITDDWISYIVRKDNTASTYIRNLVTDYTQRIGSDYYSLFSLSPDGTRMVGLGEDQLVIISLQNDHQIRNIPVNKINTFASWFTLSPSDKPFGKYVLSWAPDSSMFAVFDESDLVVVDRNGAVQKKLTVEIPAIPLALWKNCD